MEKEYKKTNKMKNEMKSNLKEILSIQPNLFGGRLEDNKTRVLIDYTAHEQQFELVFDKDELIAVIICDSIGGKVVLLGRSIGTDQDILNEICFEIHQETMKYKNEIY